ncbi:hypothetical protein KQH62_03020 [bacterium]|nr:hypothetical protein [bacterium]
MRSGQKNAVQAPDLLLLEPGMTAEETKSGCKRAMQWHLTSVVVKPCFVRQAAAALRGGEVRLGTVIGYPYGANAGRIKLYEAKRALTEGAVELLLWSNLGLLRADDLTAHRNDLTGVIGLAHMNGGRVRAALAMDALDEAGVERALTQALKAGADEVLTVYEAGIDQAAMHGLQALIATVDGRVPVGVMDGINHPGDLDALREVGCSRVGVTIERMAAFLEG